MFDETTLNQLKKNSVYKRFRRKSKIRSLVGLIIVVAFWLVMINSNNPNTPQETNTIIYGILFMGSLIIVYMMYTAFVKKPQVVFEAIIVDIREKKRTVNEEDRLRSRLSHQYCVEKNGEKYWGDCIHDYLNGKEGDHSVGERVIYFSMSAGNSYIIAL